jgi:drug/metabolite transporter (DMT)-like permease
MIVTQFSRVMATKLMTTNRMSVFLQLALIMQVLVDIFVLGQTFNWVQMIGFLLIIILYVILFAEHCCGSDKKKVVDDAGGN